MNSLKGRTTLFVAIAMVALAIGLSWLSWQREAITDRYHRESTYRERQHLWDYVLGMVAGQMQGASIQLAENGALRQAIGDRDRPGIASQIAAGRGALSEAGVDVVEIVDGEGGMLYSSLTTDRSARPMLEGWPLTELLRDGQPVSGVRLGSNGRPYIIRAFALTLPDGTRAAAIFGRPVAQLFVGDRRQLQNGEFALANNAWIFTETSNARLWGELGPLVDLGAKREQVIDADRRIWAVSPVVIADIVGGRIGYMVMAFDVTDAEGRRRLLVEITALAGFLFVVVILGMLYARLRRSFEPLDEAVGVLDAMSRGETGHWLSTSGDDEIGRLARSIEVFRRNMLDLVKVRVSRERRRRRQERFIHRQMLTLANTLEDEARAAVLHDLDDIQAAERSAQSATAGDEALSGLADFALMAKAFQHMAARVGEQQGRLTSLVRELREALEHKTRLVALEQELDIARKIQLSALPRPLPPRPEIEVAGAMRAAKEVGGDFFDYFMVDDRHLAVIVADVSGKGVPAAFFMLITRTLLRAIAQTGATPAETLGRLNDLLADENDEMMFVTLFFGILDLDTGRMVFANAGHNPPMIRRLNSAINVLPASQGMALAVVPGNDLPDETIDMAVGDIFVAFTDGVTEAHDPTSALYGEARLESELRRASGDAAGVLADVNASVDRFALGAPQADDITVLVVRYLGTGRGA